MSWTNLVITPESQESSAYRRPTQARGEEKFECILDAAHELIRDRSIDEFGLRDVAKQAGVASGSVYHFFPNNEVLYIALVERYNKEFVRIINTPINPDSVASWHDVIDRHFDNARTYINVNSPARTLILGSGRSWQARQVGSVGDSDIATAIAASIGKLFVLPSTPSPHDLLQLGLKTLEGYWELSVQQHDRVTDEFSRETTRAVTAYLGLYWSKYLERV